MFARRSSATLFLMTLVFSLSSCSFQRTILKDLSSKPVLGQTEVCFVHSKNGELSLVNVKRSALAATNKLEDAIRCLLAGPSTEEISRGLGSEIPRGTILLGLSEKNGAIELNLSRRFASGGGIDSIETRLEQVSRTVRAVAGRKPVYLNVEGKRLNMTPGEGIEIRQPINSP